MGLPNLRLGDRSFTRGMQKLVLCKKMDKDVSKKSQSPAPEDSFKFFATIFDVGCQVWGLKGSHL